MFLYRWYQKFKVVRRFNYILLVLFRAGFSALLFQAGLKKSIPISQRLDQVKVDESVLPVKLRLTLEKLGPVFVKFGQILSTRSDLLPKEYILELEKLQAQVPPFSFAEAKKIIEKDFNKPFNRVFKHFEPLAFASASLGQVYRAELFSGEQVAVKVQRPQAKELIKQDTEVMIMLAHFAEKHIEGAKNFRPLDMVQEFRRWTINELDYRKEAANCEIFSDFFKDDENVYSPKVFWDFSSGSVLTLELVKGEPLAELVAKRNKTKFNSKLVARNIADSFVKQYFEFGFFHADPHPGNIFVIPGNKLVFLDFGMIGLMDADLTALAAGLFLALLQRDVEKILSLILEVAQRYDERAEKQDIREIVNINSLRKELTELVMRWSSTGKAMSFTSLIYEMLQAAVRSGVRVPVDLVMFSKSIVTLDTVLHQLDPKLRLEEWEQPMVEKIVIERFKPDKLKHRAQQTALVLDELLKRLPQSTAGIVSNLERGRFGLEINTKQLVDYERLLNANSRFNTVATLLAGLVIAVALIYQSGTHPIVWKFTLPGWGLYLGLVLIVLFFFRIRSRGE